MSDMSFMVGSSGIANVEGRMRSSLALQSRISFGASPRHPFATQEINIDTKPNIRAQSDVKPQRGLRSQVRVRMVRPQQTPMGGGRYLEDFPVLCGLRRKINAFVKG